MTKEEFVKAFCEADENTQYLIESLLALDQEEQKRVLPIVTAWLNTEEKNVEVLKEQLFGKRGDL